MVKKVRNINKGDTESYGYNQNNRIARRAITSPHEGKKNRLHVELIEVTTAPTLIEVTTEGIITLINQSGTDIHYGGGDSIDTTYPKLLEKTFQVSKGFEMYVVASSGTVTVFLEYLTKG